MQELHVKESQTLQNKLKWYVANQKVISVYESEAEQKDSQIVALKRMLKQGQHGDGDGHRVRELERQVEKLERELLSKHPDPVANLVRANKPTLQDQNLVMDLRRQVQQLQDEV